MMPPDRAAELRTPELRTAEVLARLDHVTDPELDEPVTELGFVTAVAVDEAGVVSVEFRLPTYWCAANFAFMMADDMRREVAVLPWVTRVEPRLGEHMYADKINHGVLNNLSFQDAFGDAATDDLDELRRTFLLKAFQRRQEALLRHLQVAGHSAETLAALSLAELSRLALDAAGERLRGRYVERRGLVGVAIDGRCGAHRDPHAPSGSTAASALVASRLSRARGFSARSSTRHGINDSTQMPTDHQ